MATKLEWTIETKDNTTIEDLTLIEKDLKYLRVTDVVEKPLIANKRYRFTFKCTASNLNETIKDMKALQINDTIMILKGYHD